MSAAPIRVGIIGLSKDEGWAQRAHLPALHVLEEFRVVAVANSTSASSRRAAADFNLTGFDDAAAMARDPSIDMVAVTVKVPFHRELVETALAAGKMVFCEWPLGNGLREAESIALQAKSAGVRSLVGLQARSSPIVRHIKSLIEEGYVGEILSTTLVGSGGNWGSAVDARDAYTNDAANGADLLSIPFGHTIDALCHCCGEFTELEASATQLRSTYQIRETGEERLMLTDDQLVVSGRLVNGAVVAAHYRGGSSRGTNLLWEINGTDGDLVVTAPSGHLQLTTATLRGGRGGDRSLQPLETPADFREAPPALQDGAINVAEAYLQFARGLRANFPVPDFDAALSRHRLLDAVRQSAAKSARVSL